jgi:hypothetical protein
MQTFRDTSGVPSARMSIHRVGESTIIANWDNSTYSQIGDDGEVAHGVMTARMLHELKARLGSVLQVPQEDSDASRSSS